MVRTALITGSSRGIGREVATTFAKNGYNVVINYRNSKKEAEQLKKDLQSKYKIDAIAIQADVSKEAEIVSMVKKALAKFKKIDVLVNNAGIYETKEFFDKTAEDFEKIFRVNLLGAFLVTKYIAPQMIANKYGKIVNVSSNNSFQSYDPVTVDYDVSKAGLNILTRVMAKEFAPYVNVNAVAPGWVRTDMCKDFPEEFIKEESKSILKSRFGETKDIAELIYFLASDKAEYITGEIYRIDGGM